MLLAALTDFITTYGTNRTYWIAYSGGLDSNVLLSLFAKLSQQFPLSIKAIHVNHHLHQDADQWAQQCRQQAGLYGVDYIELSLNLQLKTGDSLEALAREKRYDALVSYLHTDDMLVCAHHQNDQAETILMQLFRGAGVKGLAAMPMLKAFGKGYLARPLLNCTRQQLQDYAAMHHIQWVDDTSNLNTAFLRNFIRHDILPMVSEKIAGVQQALSRTAGHCAEAQSLLDDYAALLLTTVTGSKPNTLSGEKLTSLPDKAQRLVLRYWIAKAGFLLPPATKMKTLLTTVLTAKADKLPQVTWQSASIRRYRDDLFVLPHPLPVYAVKRRAVIGKGVRADSDQLQLKNRLGGEIIRLPKRGHRTLKHLYQELGVPPWERNVPLLFSGDNLIAVIGHAIAEGYEAKGEASGWEYYLTQE